MSQDETSIPSGPVNDQLEPEFEKMLKDEGFELKGREKADDLEDDAADGDEPDDSKGKEPDEDKDESDKKEDDKSEDDGKKKPDEKKGKGDETWRHMIAKRRQDKSKSGDKDGKPADTAKPDLLQPENKDPEKPEAKATELSDRQKKFAEKYGIDPDDLLELFPASQQEKIEKNGLSQEDRALLDSTRAERDSLLIENGFKSDFESNVLPLIEAEYPNISKEKVAEIMKQVREKVETDEYARTPLAVIYRGDSSFRGVVKAPKNGPDNGNKVPANGTSGKVYDFNNVTDEDVKNDDFPFEKYSDFMAKQERSKKRS